MSDSLKAELIAYFTAALDNVPAGMMTDANLQKLAEHRGWTEHVLTEDGETVANPVNANQYYVFQLANAIPLKDFERLTMREAKNHARQVIAAQLNT